MPVACWVSYYCAWLARAPRAHALALMYTPEYQERVSELRSVLHCVSVCVEDMHIGSLSYSRLCARPVLTIFIHMCSALFCCFIAFPG